MLPKPVYYYGDDVPSPERIKLHAGPISMIFEPDNGFLRYVRLGDQEILRGIYAAVRDHNWDTIAPVISNLEVETTEDTFRLTFDVMCHEGDIDFFWKGTLTGDSHGTVQFIMDGVSRSTFLRNRIGFCVLHPIACAGKPCTIEKVDGTVEQSEFPLYISPHQPFMNMKAISHEVLPGLSAKVGFAGDIFETEDQRNWTDASFKTYCTPLEIPYPVEVQEGDGIAQSITITLKGELPGELSKPQRETTEVNFTVDETASRPLPEIGLGWASHGEPLSAREQERLRLLNLSHLRIDLDLSQPNVETVFRQVSVQAQGLAVSLEIALFLSDGAERELIEFATMVEEIKPPIGTILIFHKAEMSTSPRWIELARRYLPEAKIGAGTNAYFTELNRERPPTELLDGVCYSMNPQVHAFDNASLVETLETQAQTVESARQFIGDLPLAVTPITLQPRFNPNATGPEPELGADQLPSQVDVRQMSLLGGGWTLGSLKYLSESGVDSLTYYETTGWRGVMETAKGCPLPQRFRSIPGGVFPLYHVLADVGEFVGGKVIPSKSSAPLSVDGMALCKDGHIRILLANLGPEPVQVRLVCPNLTEQMWIKKLDETNVDQAMRSPESFRSDKGSLTKTEASELRLNLLPFAIVRIDSIE